MGTGCFQNNKCKNHTIHLESLSLHGALHLLAKLNKNEYVELNINTFNLSLFILFILVT